MYPQDPTPMQPIVEPQPTTTQPMFQPVTPPGPIPPNPSQPQPYGQPPMPLMGAGMVPRGKNKKPLFIGIAALAVLLLVTLLVVLLSTSKPKTVEAPQTTNEPQGPQPAQAIDVEQASNSISQDITGHDNNKDFPSGQLDDKSLGL